MIKVLVVDDSAVVRELLKYILDADPEIEVVDAVSDGRLAVEAVQRHRPDVVTMDIHMPGMNGFEVTRLIMETCPVPIVVVSGSWAPHEVATTFHALEAGALAVAARPPGITHPGHEGLARHLVQTVKLMSEVKVVRRWPRGRNPPPSPAVPGPSAPLARKPGLSLVAIGASTGGPVAIQTILAGVPEHFPLPFLVVQHMAQGFVRGFAEWLSQACRRPVHVAVHNQPLLPGHVYVAPDSLEMGVGPGPRIVLAEPDARAARDAPRTDVRNCHVPSVAHLFRSAAEVYGARAIGILLSGMGTDGAEELRLMRERGAITFAQDKESAVIHGMPGRAIERDAAVHVLPPNQIGATLASLVAQGRGRQVHEI